VKLADLQREFLQAVLAGETPPGFLAGPVPPQEALRIHRDTIAGALTNALRLSYPTVEALVGTAFFDQACQVFAQQNLPRTADLSAYGGNFADFLAAFEAAVTLPYLPDVARLDRAVEAALRAPAAIRRFVMDATIAIDLPHSLVVLPLLYPADEIRAALLDDAAMAAIDTRPAERFVLVWRKDSSAAVKPASPAAGRFLMALLAEESFDQALQAALADASEAEVLQAIQAEIFTASFCTLIPTPRELSP
jgi:hypothetical protein